MSINKLENEYMTQKEMIKNDKETIQKMNSLDEKEMTEQQIQSRDKVISSKLEDIKEYELILEDIKQELIEEYENGSELSETMKKELKLNDADESSASIEITGIKPVNLGGVVSGDYSNAINDEYITVSFSYEIEGDKIENEIRVHVDMDYNDIDFNNIESISKTMLKEAWDGAYVKYAQNLIDYEIIDGEFGFDYEIEDPEEMEWENIRNDDVSQFHDIINMTPPKERGYVARRLLEVKGVLKNDDSEDNDSESMIIEFKLHFKEEEVEGYLDTDNSPEEPFRFYDGGNESVTFPANPYPRDNPRTSLEMTCWNDYEYMKQVFFETDVVSVLNEAKEGDIIVIGEDAYGDEVVLIKGE